MLEPATVSGQDRFTAAAAKPDASADVALSPDPALVSRIRGEIRLSDRAQLVSFGDDAQRDVAAYADQILRNTLNRDSGTAGNLLTELLTAVNKLDPASLRNASFLQRMFGGLKAKLLRFKEQFSTLASQVDRVSLELERHQDTLRRDIAMLDGLYDRNLGHLRQLEAYIVAGTEVVAETQRTGVPEIEKRVAAAGDGVAGQMAAQELNDLRQSLDRLERKVHDLKLSRVIAMQTMPQIRLIQNGDAALAEKLQSSITATIPTWKNQMTIALALNRQEEALALQRRVSETTNEMLKRNAEQLRSGMTGIEREAQRGIVDVETLAQVNRQFIDTVNEVLQIQRDGRQRRQAAETALQRIEAELKRTLAQAIPQGNVRP
ncbi:MAG TPA: toxic anion resistance protein [Xanthobacteraceae bacterium]|nr:toxic anion resistance protein [Xanthobacteraceae bacterium]